MIRFHFPDGSVREVGPAIRELNLLAHAQLEELSIGSRCGGHGKCGGDRVRVTDPSLRHTLSPPTEAERRLLGTEEIHRGWRLACQAFPDDPSVTLNIEVLQIISKG
jgi:ferredoxin